MIYYIGEERKFNQPNIELSTIDYALGYLNSLESISCDTETQGFDCHTKDLLLLQLGNKEKQFVINPQFIDTLIFKELLETKLILFHNAKFDWKFLYKQGIDVKNIYDTFLAECVLTTGYTDDERDLSLKGVTHKYLNVDLDKSIRGDIHRLGIVESVIEYGARDVEYLEDIMNTQLVQIDKWDLRKVLDLENKVVRVFSIMEYQGISFDKTKITEISKELDVINKDLIKKLDDIIIKDSLTNTKLIPYTQVQCDLFTDDIRGTNINWKSPAQKTEILHKVGLKIDDVSDKTLQKNKSKHPLVPLYIDLSKFNKLKDSFGTPLLKFINPVTQRIHAETWQILSTGRISMSNPNCQQIPAHSSIGQAIKSCFIASEGYKMVSADYSGMELRCIAEYSGDPLWVNTFKNRQDLHSILCAETFGIPIEDVKNPFPPKPDISYRFLQKTINFGLSYGMSEYKLADTAQISVVEARNIITRFFKKVPLVEHFLNKLAYAGVKYGYIRTDQYFRRIRWFTNLDVTNFKVVGEVERASKNSVPQGTNANITKLALCMLQDIIDENNYPVNILLTIHDEVLTECIAEFAEEWKIILEKIMIEAAETIIKTVPVEVEGIISDYWTK